MKNFDEMQKASQQAMDVTTKSLAEMNKGMQTLATELTDFTKKSFEDSTATMEKLMGVRSLEQAIEIQSGFMRTSYEGAVAQATTVGEIYAEMSQGAMKPVQKAARKAK